MITWQYIAGFTDGEGCIRWISNHKYGGSPRIVLAQSGDIGFTILSKIKNFLIANGIPINKLNTSEPGKLGKLLEHRLFITSRASATSFLTQLLPYLEVKKLEAQDLLRHMKIYPAIGKGGWLAQESRKINKKKEQQLCPPAQ